ncbi:voltage-gated potassium channel subunit beta-2 [Copidosoma floridanum]|uniref:voltage-gated potassium channel subunit beta-2 n=1 Tax=Copidosoma floridanum TaxID=29053 RepID=UPI000C6FAF4E|nr:voltage-gated potassium channel subunit beta-2 [Copidosoma floridanum]
MSHVMLCNLGQPAPSSAARGGGGGSGPDTSASSSQQREQRDQRERHERQHNCNNSNSNSSMDDDDSYPLPTIYRCRAPIASLDCMEEFNGGAGTDSSGHYGSTPGTKDHLLASCLAGQSLQRAGLQHNPSPGIRYRNLGKSGLRVSNVGLGTWTMFGGVNGTNTEDNAEAIIALAYESGINVFDLSEAHSGPKAETQLGRILQKRNWTRTSYIVTTKIYWNPKSEARGLSRKFIIETVQASLARLQLSYIDIVMIHKVDSTCPMEEIVRAMNYVIDQGWVMYWGTSRWSPCEIMEAYSNCRQFNCVTPIVEQAEYHLFYREKPELYMPELYNKIGVGLMCWSSISIGLISSRVDDSGGMSVLPRSRSSYKNKSFSWTEDESEILCKEEQWRKASVDSETRKGPDKVREICAFAERLGCTFTQLAIAWTLKNESVQCLLLGATNVEQLYDNIQSLQLIPRLTVATMTEIERILLNKPIRPPMISTLQLR